MHKSPYIAVLTWGVFAALLLALPGHEPHAAWTPTAGCRAGRDLDRAGAGADRAVGLVYFSRDHPSEQSWKTTSARGSGFAGQLVVLALFYQYRDVRGRGQRALRQGAHHDRVENWYAVPISWLGIIGIAVPVLSLGVCAHDSGANPEKYAHMGRFVNESV